MLLLIDEADSNLYLLGVSFIISDTITAALSTSLKEILTYLMVSFSSFSAYSIKGVYSFLKYLAYFLNSSVLYGYLKSILATFKIL